MSYLINGEEHDVVIADKDMVVHDDNLGIDRQIVAGTPVPPDLLDAYKGGPSKGDRGPAASKAHRSPQRDK